MEEFKLKKDMLIGAASAATQIEGGSCHHSWMDWAKKGHITDGSGPWRANDHYRLYPEDTKLMKSLDMQIYRMGVEWARIEPSPGIFDREAIKHYTDEIRLLGTYGIRPLVTLHHFTNPLWFEQKGGFKNIRNIRYYLRFVKVMVAAFGETVNEYITINEPNVYAVNGYFFGIWPPGSQSLAKTIQVMNVLAKAHILAYERIHAQRERMGYTDTKVSFANHMRCFAPANPNRRRDRFYADLNELFFQESFSKAAMTGDFTFPLRSDKPGRQGQYCDFIALNYYTRSSVSGLSDGVKSGVPVNDLGWEIYPQGIVECAKKLYSILPVPIYITENGTCDNEDRFRSRYLYEHLKVLTESALPIRRYYHWCFCDNFEWIEGESARFGIVHVDYETQKRTVKSSGYFLQDIIQNQGVTKEAYNKYVRMQVYPYN